MVDIHCHVLPGVDDGAHTLKESLEMLKLAAASGTTDLVATPHSNTEFPFDDSRIEEVFRELSLKTAGIIRLHRGCDFHLNLHNIEDALTHPTKYTINHGPYLLVELPDFIGFSVVRQQLQALMHARMQPILTHPERNFSLQATLDPLKEWVGDGCLVQVTAQSFLGRFGSNPRKIAQSLMHANLVHFVASDAHDCVDRPPRLADAYQHVQERWGDARAETVFRENPAAVIQGDVISQARKRPLWTRLFHP